MNSYYYLLKRFRSIIAIFAVQMFLLCLCWYLTDITSRHLDVSLEYGNRILQQGRKVKRIAFLRIPKTGSSTTICIFLRFAIHNNLTVFYPMLGFVDSSLKADLLTHQKRFDVFVPHTHYEQYFFTHIVRNPAIVGLVRDPIQRIISHAFFFKLYKRFKELRGLSSQDFINKVVKNTTRYKLLKYTSTYFGINTAVGIQRQLTKLNYDFLLVLVLERYNESLVLLKRRLNWTVSDILYAPKKVNPHEQVYLNKTQRKFLKYSHKIEYDVYDYFNKELQRKIDNEGEDFKYEVEYFEQLLIQTKIFCQEKSKYKQIHTFPASRWDEGFSISRNDCELFEMDVRAISESKLVNIQM